MADDLQTSYILDLESHITHLEHQLASHQSDESRAREIEQLREDIQVAKMETEEYKERMETYRQQVIRAEKKVEEREYRIVGMPTLWGEKGKTM